MSKVVHMLKHECLPQMFRTLFPFIYSSIIPTSFSSVLARFSLPLHLECYLRVWWTVKFWASTITVMKVRIWLIWDNEDTLAINLDQLITAVQVDSYIDLYLALRTTYFLCSVLFLWFPSGHIHWYMTYAPSGSNDCHCKEFRAASFEIYSLPMQLRIQVWTLVRKWIRTCWTVKDRLALDAWMCV